MAIVKRETLHRSSFDLHAMLRRVVARESASHPVGQVEIRGPQELPMEGDEELLERAFENVVRNAFEAAGPSGRAWITIEPDPAGVLVHVEDDGPGWSGDLADAFRPFASTKSGGLGLGLPMARKIARLHGGDIRIGTRGKGAWVVVSLNHPDIAERSET